MCCIYRVPCGSPRGSHPTLVPCGSPRGSHPTLVPCGSPRGSHPTLVPCGSPRGSHPSLVLEGRGAGHRVHCTRCAGGSLPLVSPATHLPTAWPPYHQRRRVSSPVLPKPQPQPETPTPVQPTRHAQAAADQMEAVTLARWRGESLASALPSPKGSAPGRGSTAERLGRDGSTPGRGSAVDVRGGAEPRGDTGALTDVPVETCDASVPLHWHKECRGERS